MTSSVLDGAGCDSPAPPAFSPLTDPADPGNREQSVDAPPLGDEALDRLDKLDNAAPEVHTPTVQQHADFAAHAAASVAQLNGNSHMQAAEPTTPARAASLQQQQNTIGDVMDLDTPMGSAIDYTTSPGFDLYSQQSSGQLLMALARLSAASQQSQLLSLPPPTVRPSQVSLPPQSVLGTSGGLIPATHDAASNPPSVEAPLESFARIEFADSVFQMTTYAVIIGRDQRALDQARRDERRLDDYQRRVRENEELGLPAPAPPLQDRGKFSKSYVSEEGGMLGPESDGEDNPRPSKRRKTSDGAGSAPGESHPVEAAAGESASLEEKNTALNRQYVSHTPGAAAVNLSALRPSPYYVPFIGIHSPGPNIASRTKAISREHLKIEFNQKEGVFEAIPLHKNGFFCEDVHYKDEKVVLKSGDRLQIKDVDFVFMINGVPRGKTGAEEGIDGDGVSSRRYSEGGKEMSFDFEGTHDHERRSTSPEEVAPTAVREDSDSELSEPAEDIPEPEPEETPEQEVMETIEKDPEVPPAIKTEMSLEMLASLEPIIPKKRGPGRPPKNGIMSKREERARKKAAMELAKKNMPQPPPGEPPVKRKVGRPRKHPLPEDGGDRPEKRKYKPRKSKTGEEGEGSDVEKTIKERRREKPKTPPLELNRADYTEEQLQKPPKNYGMLIDEVLTAAPDGLTLKQIYKRIQMKYPFYYFTVDTKGWESSVRHNLIGNDAFKKNDETHLWSRVPGIDIDAGKKRTKATSPDHPSSMHTFGQHYSSATPTPQMFHTETGMQHGYRSGSAPQRTPYPAGHGQVAHGQHPQPQLGVQAGGVVQQAARQTYPTSVQMQGATATNAYGNPTTGHPPQGSAQPTAYSSPYASRRPLTAAAQPGSLPQGAARQGPPPNYVASPVNGLPRVGTAAAQTVPPAGARPVQPTASGSALPLKPAVAPEMVRHVTNFVKTVTEQLSKRTPAAEAVAMSVINRGLGLAAESTVPEEENLEKIVLGVFESSRKNLGANHSLHPDLVQTLRNFQNNMIKTLEPKMGKLNAERLILSAVDRVLGFADQSTMPGPDKKQYDEAENVLISAIRQVVTKHQGTLAAAASASAPQTTPRPGPPRPTPAAPGMPAPSAGSAPAPSPAVAGTYSAAALQTTGATSTTPASVSTNTVPGVARPQAPVPAAPAAPPAKAFTSTATAQQVPGIAQGQVVSQTTAAHTTRVSPQAPVPNMTQAITQAPGHHLSATANPAFPQAGGSARDLVSPPGAGQPVTQKPYQAAPQPQTPAHALAQAQAQAAARMAAEQKPAQVPAPVAASAATAAQTLSQSVPPTTIAAAAAALSRPPTSVQTPTAAQPRAQETQFSRPQVPAQSGNQVQSANSAPSHGHGQGAPVPDMAPVPAKAQVGVSAPASAQGIGAAPKPNPAPLQTVPATATPKLAQPAPVAASVTAPIASQEKVSPAPAPPPQAPAQKPVQAPGTALSYGPVSSTSPEKIASASLPTSQAASHSPTPTAPAVATSPTPAQNTSQAQTTPPAPSTSQSQSPSQMASLPAPVANMATTNTAGAGVPPPSPAPATATAAR